AGDVAALGDDLVTARAVVGEGAHALGEAAALGVRPRDRWPLAERRHVGDQRADLAARQQDATPARLQTDVLERHVAGRQVEVGGERADAAQRRRHAFLLRLQPQRAAADPLRPRLRDAAAVRAVTRDAVLAVEVFPPLHEPAFRRSGRAGNGQTAT